MTSALSDEFFERPSKSQRKREMAAAQALGEQLLQLKPDVLRSMPLDERLLDTLLQAQNMTQHEARRRHLQLVGKLMRVADIEAIQSAFEATQAGSREANQILHALEHWRTRLLTEGDNAVGEVLKVFPGTESQTLRQLLRDVRRETEQGKPPAAARKLFRYLKQHYSPVIA